MSLLSFTWSYETLFNRSFINFLMEYGLFPRMFGLDGKSAEEVTADEPH
jgi:hypothetical protein